MIMTLSPNEITNLISGGVGSLSGFIVRMQQNNHVRSMRLLDTLEKKYTRNIEDQQDARKYNSSFMNTMRLMMVLVLGGGILIMFLLPGFFHWPVNVETIHSAGIFNKLFHGNEVHKWRTFQGLVIPEQFWQLCFYICGFLFGGRR